MKNSVPYCLHRLLYGLPEIRETIISLLPNPNIVNSIVLPYLLQESLVHLNGTSSPLDFSTNVHNNVETDVPINFICEHIWLNYSNRVVFHRMKSIPILSIKISKFEQKFQLIELQSILPDLDQLVLSTDCTKDFSLPLNYPLALSQMWHTQYLLLPRNMFIDYLLRFVNTKNRTLLSVYSDFFSNEGKYSGNIIEIDEKDETELKELKNFNSHDSLNFNVDFFPQSTWHWKRYILCLFFDLTNYFLFPTNSNFPVLDSHHLDSTDCYPWIDWELNKSFTFPILWESLENQVQHASPHLYLLNLYKSTSSNAAYVKRSFHYYVSIKNSETSKINEVKEESNLRYYRGSIVSHNPISAIIFFLLTRTDDKLTHFFPSLPAHVFRRLLLQHIYIVHDWN